MRSASSVRGCGERSCVKCGETESGRESAGTGIQDPQSGPLTADNTGEMSPAELYDAHACGKEDVALQATRTRRNGSLCEP